MAEPARNLDDDLNPANRRSSLRLVKGGEQGQEAQSGGERPNLQVIQGGGQTSAPTGKLRSVNDDDTEDLEAQESAATTPDFSGGAQGAERAQLAGIAGGQQPWKTNLKNKNVTLPSAIKNSKKYMVIGGGIGTGVISLVVAIMSFLAPYRTESIIQYIENRIPKVAMVAAQERLEVYVIRYLILRAVAAQGIDVEKDRTYTYIGTWIPETLYTNWKGAGLEKTLEEQGYKLTSERPVGSIFGRDLIDPTHWRLEYTNVKDPKTGKAKVMRLDSIEARNFMRGFMEEHLKTQSVAERHIMKIVAGRYFGYKGFWKPFERTRNNTTEWAREKKASFLKGMTRVTLGRMAPVRAAQITCLLDGGENCKPESLQAQDTPELDGETGKIVDDATKEGDSKKATSILTDALQKTGLKYIMTTAATGLGVLKFISAVHAAGEIQAWIHYTNIAQSYAGEYFYIRSANDQIRSGEDFDDIDPAILAEAFDGFEASPAYQETTPDGSKVMAAGQFMADCDNNGSNETALAPGETICQNKKLIRTDGGIRNEPWYPVLGPFAAAYDSLIKKPLEWATAPLQSVLDAAGVTGAMEYILDKSGVAKEGMDLIMMALGDFVGHGADGSERSKSLYEAMVIGHTAVETAMGGPVQGSRAGSVGGAYLTAAQVSAIHQEELSYRQYALSQKSVLERYFSPDVDTSLTSYAIMHTPASITSLSNSFLNAINPINIFTQLGSLFTARSSALAGQGSFYNPAGGIFTGIPREHPSTQMSVEELNATYHCSKPEEDRPQNNKMGRPDGVPFDVHTEADPCEREKLVEKIGIGFITGKYDDSE